MWAKAFWAENSNLEFSGQTRCPSRLGAGLAGVVVAAASIVQAHVGTGQAVRAAQNGEKTERLGGGASSGWR